MRQDGLARRRQLGLLIALGVWACGEGAYLPGYRSAFHSRYTQEGLPICERGSTLQVIDDDGSERFEQLYTRVQRAGVLFSTGED